MFTCAISFLVVPLVNIITACWVFMSVRLCQQQTNASTVNSNYFFPIHHECYGSSDWSSARISLSAMLTCLCLCFLLNPTAKALWCHDEEGWGSCSAVAVDIIYPECSRGG